MFKCPNKYFKMGITCRIPPPNHRKKRWHKKSQNQARFAGFNNNLNQRPSRLVHRREKTKSEHSLTTPIATIRAWLNCRRPPRPMQRREKHKVGANISTIRAWLIYRLPLSLISLADVDTDAHTHMSSARNLWTERHTHGWTHGRMDRWTRQEVSDIYIH